MDRAFVQASFNYGARDPRLIDLVSFEETNDESVLVFPYIPPESKFPASGNGIEHQACTVHFGTVSKDFSKINLHRKIKGEAKITGGSLTSAIKHGGWAHVMSVMQAYRVSEAGNTSESPGKRYIASQLDALNGQVIYHIAVGARGAQLKPEHEITKLFGPYVRLDIGRFRFLIFIVQTELPMTSQGFTMGSKTIAPEDLNEEDERLMRSVMDGLSEDELLSELIVMEAALVHHLCAKIELYPSDNYFIWTNYNTVRRKFEDAKLKARGLLERASRLHIIDPTVDHPISVFSSSDLQIKFNPPF